MWKNILRKIAMILFKAYLLPGLKDKSKLILNGMSDKVIESEFNPISVETIGDIRKHADKAIDDLFEDFE